MTKGGDNMSMEYAEDLSIFRCTQCGHRVITEQDEQPPEICDNCEEIKLLKDALFYLSNYCGFRNDNCEKLCAIKKLNHDSVCPIQDDVPENWEFLNALSLKDI